MDADLQKQVIELCWHEAGHLVACRHFRLKAKAVVWSDKSSQALSVSGHVEHNPTTPLKTAIIAWAGPLAEFVFHAAEHNPDQARYLLFNEHHWCLELADWIRHNTDAISESDRAGIFGHRQQLRAVRIALRLLARRLGAVRSEADRLYAEFNETAEL